MSIIANALNTKGKAALFSIDDFKMEHINANPAVEMSQPISKSRINTNLPEGICGSKLKAKGTQTVIQNVHNKPLAKVMEKISLSVKVSPPEVETDFIFQTSRAILNMIMLPANEINWKYTGSNFTKESKIMMLQAAATSAIKDHQTSFMALLSPWLRTWVNVAVSIGPGIAPAMRPSVMPLRTKKTNIIKFNF